MAPPKFAAGFVAHFLEFPGARATNQTALLEASSLTDEPQAEQDALRQHMALDRISARTVSVNEAKWAEPTPFCLPVPPPGRSTPMNGGRR